MSVTVIAPVTCEIREKNVFSLANSNSPTCTYSATAQASVEYQTLSGCPNTTAIPLENDGGTGTACGHWDDECFGKKM